MIIDCFNLLFLFVRCLFYYLVDRKEMFYVIYYKIWHVSYTFIHKMIKIIQYKFVINMRDINKNIKINMKVASKFIRVAHN